MFQYISDIHLEYITYIPSIKKTAENLLLLGDIGHPGTSAYTAFINNCSEKFKNVIVIYGNHENYSITKGKNKKIETMSRRMLYTLNFPKNVYFLNNSCLFFNKINSTVKLTLDDNDDQSSFIKIIGSTLWTDCVYNISDNNYKNIYVDNELVNEPVNDTVNYTVNEPVKLLDFNYQSKLFNESKSYILKEIDTHKNMKCILLTHYSTHKLCNIYIDNKDYNHIYELFTKQNLLACINGHTHVSIKTVATGTSIKLLANCYGYKNENQDIVKYDEYSVLDINDISAVSFYGIYAAKINYQEIFKYISNRKNQLFDLGQISESNASYIITHNVKDNIILYSSSTFTQLTGYNSQEILGKNCRFLQSPNEVKKNSFRYDCDDNQIYNMRENIKCNKECQYILKNYKKNKELFINILTIIPIVYNSIQYIIGLQNDITDSINNLSYNNLINPINNNLNKIMSINIKFDMYLKENCLNDNPIIMNNSSYMLLITDFLGNIEQANDIFITKTGYNTDEIYNTNIKNYINENDDIDLKNNLITTRFVTKNIQTLNFIWKIKKQNKKLFYIIYDVTRANKDSNVIHTMINEQINERKIISSSNSIETKKKLHKEFDNNIFLNMSDNILTVINLEGEVVYINNTFIKHTGYTFTDVSNKLFYDFILPDYIDKAIEVFSSINSTNNLQFINQIITKKGLLKINWSVILKKEYIYCIGKVINKCRN